MNFNQPIFLFFFLPLVLLLYAALGKRCKNVLLLAASLAFCAWDDGVSLLVILASIIMNYAFGLALVRWRDWDKAILAVALSADIALLAWFKYADFAVENFNHLLDFFNLPTQPPPHTHLPLGISFFTFQVMSYLIDIYRRQIVPQNNPLNFSLYVALFPKMVAGPIARYQQIIRDIEHRPISLADFAAGARRFVIGLGKKILIADVLAKAVDICFGLPAAQLSAAMAIFGAIAFTLQIYYDFSGYSDMAIGLGRMFGFRFPENFDHPYHALSIREFWQRWHMTLSSWFRDYLYIPLGGNRSGAFATGRNLLAVFLLCGLWHGANWTFVCWGLWHGLFLILERPAAIRRWFARTPQLFRHLYAMTVVTVGWVLFRADSLSQAGDYLGAFTRLSTPNPWNTQIFLVMNNELWLTFALALLVASPLSRSLAHVLVRRQGLVAQGLSFCFFAFVFLYSLASLSGMTHHPFLYSRF
ncbi:MAG: MBOAT family protein [Desulfobulbaceae bacterium]|jgi:alginate O-acetyltransferase complex protein AlgI|nr:MBOAT family protein [Desulfobulbaceae bacterium]